MIKPYEGNEQYIFVSYSHKDTDIVLPLIKKLQDKYNIWFDERINPGSEWADTISNKISNCSLFIYAITKNSISSSNCLDEIALARDLEKPFINLFIDNTELTGGLKLRLNRYQHFFFNRFNNNEEAITMFVSSVGDIAKECLKKIPNIKNENFEKEIFNVKVSKIQELTVKEKERVQIIQSVLDEYKIPFTVTDYYFGEVSSKIVVENLTYVSRDTIKKVLPIISSRLGNYDVSYEAYNPDNEHDTFYLFDKSLSVSFKEGFEALPDAKKNPLAISFGKALHGSYLSGDINNFPHMLVAGTAGSGKSVFLHNIINTLIFRNTPEQVRLVLIDPKRVEFYRYKDMPHLYCPIVNNEKDGQHVLDYLVNEMNHRYMLFEEGDCSASLNEYNSWAKKNNKDTLPYIVVLIDEYVDLYYSRPEVSNYIVSLIQKARASGIFVILSTQRVFTDALSWTALANMPTKAVFSLNTKKDSIIVIDEPGAEELLGRGDMLLKCPAISRKLIRIQGCYISGREISENVENVKKKYPLFYLYNYWNIDLNTNASNDVTNNQEDDKYEEIKAWVYNQEYISLSKIQRECEVGFNRARLYLKKLQEDGIIALFSEPKKGFKVLK